MGLVRWMDRTFYPGIGSNWDDDVLRRRLVECLTPTSVVLDLGAGRGLVRQMDVRGLAGRICGIDRDVRVLDNPYLDDARVADAVDVPYPDATFHVIFANNVLEHLEEPGAAFKEVKRLLRPGGVFLFKTPNRRHYVPTIARLTRHSIHERVNRLRGRAATDTHPTRYRANSGKDIGRLAAEAGLQVVRFDHVEGRPEYMRLTPATYFLGLCYERLVNRFDALRGLRVILVGELRRPERSGP